MKLFNNYTLRCECLWAHQQLSSLTLYCTIPPKIKVSWEVNPSRLKIDGCIQIAHHPSCVVVAHKPANIRSIGIAFGR